MNSSVRNAFNSIIFRVEVQNALDTPEVAGQFRSLQNISARLAEALPPEYRNAANLLMAFVMTSPPSMADEVLETFANLLDGLPPSRDDEASGVDGDTPAEGAAQ